MADRGTWQVYIEDSGGSWITDGTIWRPNENLEFEKMSNINPIKLADGNKALVNTETKYTWSTMSFTWLKDDGTMKTKIEDYISNGDKVKIVDHLNEEYIGKFVSCRRVWLSGLSYVDYDIIAMFERLNS